MHERVVEIAGRHYRRATWSRRILAQTIDIVLIIVIIAAGGENLALITVPAAIIYLLCGSGLLGGRSVGKRLTGLKIIDARHGGACSPVQDFVRHRYLFFANPIFLMLSAYDTSQGYFDTPETFVVEANALSTAEEEALREKPARLDLEAMRRRMQRPDNKP